MTRPAGPVARPRPGPAPLAALVLLAALAGLGACGGEPPLRIVVISLDTTRPDHLSAYGYDRETTPTLSRLAREGALFTNARATSSWTLPSHMSLFTGLPPGLHDVVIDFQSLDPGRRTLGEIFRQAGFRTAGVYSAPYVHGKYGFDRGMEYYERGTLEPMVLDLPPAQRKPQLELRERIGHQEVTSQLVTDRGLSLLDRMADRPRSLLFLHYFDAHYDYMAPPRIAERFIDRAYTGPVTGKTAATVAFDLPEDPPSSDVAQLEGYYDAELAWIDENLGRLLARQEERGELEQTLVVVTADHGEAFFEHGRYGHRYDLHDEVLRVPLIVWAPGRVPARVIDDPVSITDVLPTLMDYAGIPADPALDGRSLKPLIEGARLPPRPVTAALSFFPPPPARGHYLLHESMITGGLKLIRQVQVPWSPDAQQEIDAAPEPGSERFAVYDLAVDPGERHNLVGTGDERVDPLTEAFFAERERQRERLAGFQPRGSDTPLDDLPLWESMRANGYLGK